MRKPAGQLIFAAHLYNRMDSTDPYPVLKMLQAHLEGRLRQGGTRLWLESGAAEALREIVRMKPKPWPAAAPPATALPLVPEPVPDFGTLQTTAPQEAPGMAEATPAPTAPVADMIAEIPATEEPLRLQEAPFSPHPQRLVLPEMPAPAAVTAEILTLEEKESRLAEVRERAARGTAARELGTLREKMVFAVGYPMADIVLVGEAPGAEEERQGEPFVGPAGQLLTKILRVMGLERDQVYITNICKYRPAMENQGGGNRPPSPQEMASCLDFVREELAIIRPKVIVALGGTAITGLLGIKQGVMSARGKFYEFGGMPVMATLHPSYLLRKEAEGPEIATAEKRKLWEDMLMVMEKAGLPISDKQRRFFLPK